MTVGIAGMSMYAGGILWGAATRDPPPWTGWGLLLAAIGLAGLYAHGRWSKRLDAERQSERDRRFARLAPADAPAVDLSEPPQAALRDLATWHALDDVAREQSARWLADALPTGWRFLELRGCELGEQRHTNAFFGWQDAEFALLPGGQITLGYDANEPFVPTAAQLESWRNCDGLRDESEDRLRALLGEFLSASLTPLREVRLGPFLLERTARTYERLEEVEGQYAAGFRPPTSDQWEYACGAGARTLFRWGDDCPADRYPEELRGADDWHLHTRANAFGLTIGDNPWEPELCAEPGVKRGGDGGDAGCGGWGAFHGWLSLATFSRSRGQLVGPAGPAFAARCRWVRRHEPGNVSNGHASARGTAQTTRKACWGRDFNCVSWLMANCRRMLAWYNGAPSDADSRGVWHRLWLGRRSRTAVVPGGISLVHFLSENGIGCPAILRSAGRCPGALGVGCSFCRP